MCRIGLTSHVRPVCFRAGHPFYGCPDWKMSAGIDRMDMKTRHATLGSLVKSLRARNGWTLKEMSERVDIPVSTLSKVEHDRLTLTYDKLQQLSTRLNMRMSELFAD